MKIGEKHPVNRIGQQIVKYFWKIFRSLLIMGISYIILFPLFTKISASVTAQVDLFDPTVAWIPKNFTFDHYRVVFRNLNYPEAFFNSFSLSLIVSTIQLLSCTVIGYGFARFKFRGNNLVFALVIFTLVVPPQMFMIPLYLNFRYFDIFGLLPGNGVNLLGTYWPLILTSLTGTGFRNGLFIFIMRQFFKGMPYQLEEAAYIDGANVFKTFYKIMLPGAIPAMVIVFLFAFVWQWNDYYFITIFLEGETLLPIKLDNLIVNVMEGDHTQFHGAYPSLLNNTGMLMFIAPILILYAFMQRYFVESIERTGLVG